VELFLQEKFKDFGEQPSQITENTVGEYRIVENGRFIYYGEVKRDNPNMILGKGIKVIKSNAELFEGWHFDENNCTGNGRWISGNSRMIYVGGLKDSKCEGYGEMR